MKNYLQLQKINLVNQLILAFLFFVYIPFLLVYSMDIYDSGFILSFVGRLREGQIIYKDFDVVRPFGTLLFWDLLLRPFSISSQYLFIIARSILVLEAISIAVIIPKILSIDFKSNINSRISISVFVFITFLHTFVIMPWHTVDGILFSIIGVYFLKEKKYLTAIIFACISITLKQSFYISGAILFLVNSYLLVKSNFKSQKSDVVLFSLITAFCVFLLYKYEILENFNLFLIQSKQPDSFQQLITSGIYSYFFKNTWATIVFVVILLIIIFYSKLSENLLFYFSIISFVAICITAFYNKGSLQFVNQFFLILLSISLRKNNFSYISLLVFMVAWSSSLSWGYNTPILLVGTLIIFTFQSIITHYNLNYWNPIILVLFISSRVIYPYFNENFLKEKYVFCTDLPIISGIYMPKKIYNYYKETQAIKNKYKKVVYIPGTPMADVITNSYHNRASWEMDVEYPNYKSDLKNNNLIIFAVDKNPKIPIKEGFYKSSYSSWIMETKKKIDSTNYFYILK